jgi:SOS-response transcriptional repressor LexA
MSACDKTSEPFALQVHGTSMEPEFEDSCIIIVDPNMPIHHKAYAVVEYDNDIQLRQFIVDEQGDHYLKPLNDAWHTQKLEGEYTVRGIVVQKKLRRRKVKHYY